MYCTNLRNNFWVLQYKRKIFTFSACSLLLSLDVKSAMQLPWSWKLIHKQFIHIQDYNTAKTIKINMIKLCLTWNCAQNTQNIYLVKAVVPEIFDLFLKHLAQISCPNCSLHLCFQLRLTNVSSRIHLATKSSSISGTRFRIHKNTNFITVKLE